MDVIHTAIWVSDMEASREFFVDTLGLSEQRQFTSNGVENLFIGSENGAIQLRTEPDRAVPPEERSRLDHIAISVGDIDTVCGRLEEVATCEITRGPETIDDLDVRIAFVEVPDEYVIELVQDLD